MVKIIISDEDMAQAEEYASKGCQNGTIAGLMDWEHNFIDEREDIRKKLTKKRQERKYRLRTAQDDKAIDIKDTAMLIFLGKNDLGQTDKREMEVKGTLTFTQALSGAIADDSDG